MKSTRITINFNGRAYTLFSRVHVKDLYVAMYDRLDQLFKEYNPCEIYDGECLKGRIVRERKTKIPFNIIYTAFPQYASKNFCCDGCRFLRSSGCTERCMACKVHLCDFVKRDKLHKNFIKERNAIEQLASTLDMLFVRGSLDKAVKYSSILVGKMYGKTLPNI